MCGESLCHHDMTQAVAEYRNVEEAGSWAGGDYPTLLKEIPSHYLQTN